MNTDGTAFDLSPLERAAARAGLPGMSARAVAPDPRRGTWFRWRGHELAVSEAVLERCPPDDASALLVMTICERRRLRRFGRGLVPVGVLALLAVAGLGEAFGATAALVAAAFVVCGLGAYVLHARGRIWRDADDEAVALMGDAQPLVRGLNRMNQEELVLGSLRMPARPDLHERAERLIREHRLLCEPSGDAP